MAITPKGITVHDLWYVCPGNYIFVAKGNSPPELYSGGQPTGSCVVERVQARPYPNYGVVLEVRVKGE